MTVPLRPSMDACLLENAQASHRRLVCWSMWAQLHGLVSVLLDSKALCDTDTDNSSDWGTSVRQCVSSSSMGSSMDAQAAGRRFHAQDVERALWSEALAKKPPKKPTGKRKR